MVSAWRYHLPWNTDVFPYIPGRSMARLVIKIEPRSDLTPMRFFFGVFWSLRFTPTGPISNIEIWNWRLCQRNTSTCRQNRYWKFRKEEYACVTKANNWMFNKYFIILLRKTMFYLKSKSSSHIVPSLKYKMILA